MMGTKHEVHEQCLVAIKCVEQMWGNILVSFLHNLHGFISALFLFFLQFHPYIQKFSAKRTFFTVVSFIFCVLLEENFVNKSNN